MVPAKYNFTHYRGDKFETTINVFDSNGDVLTGPWTQAMFGIASQKGDYANLSVIGSASYVTGKITIGLTSAQSYSLSPGSYFYDVVLFSGTAGNYTNEYTVLTGTFTVEQDVIKPGLG